MHLGQAAPEKAEAQHGQQEAERKRQLHPIPAIDVDDVFGNRLADLFVDDVDVLHAQPQIPPAFAQEQEELEQVGTTAAVPVAGVEPNPGFVEEDAAELFFVVGFVTHAQADQVFG
ncbi:hypothetical protein D9M69_600520 [compost metagenome]